jgi:F0F1-type ATP synthase membrane subunit b/b'
MRALSVLPRRRLAVSVLLFLPAASALAAESVVHMKDGSTIRGEIIAEDYDAIRVKVRFGTVTCNRSNISSIEKPGDGGGEDAAGVEEAAKWRDVVALKSGDEMKGFIVSESRDAIVFDMVVRGKRPSKARVVRTTLSRDEIKDVQRLTADRRAAARNHFEDVKKGNRLGSFAVRDVEVEPTVWPSEGGAGKVPARKVELDHFIIVADADEDFLTKVALRLAGVFDAFKERLGADRNASLKVRILIFGSMKDYYSAIGREPANPATYTPDLRQIAAACEMRKYEADIAKTRMDRERLRNRLEDIKANVERARADARRRNSEIYDRIQKDRKAGAQRKAALEQWRRQKRQSEARIAEMREPSRDIEKELRALVGTNDQLFEEHVGHMIATLQHEGLHAYVDQFLFGDELAGHFPRWLDEGLAQYFEIAKVDGRFLVLGREDHKRVVYLRRRGKEGALAPFEEMLAAGPEEFATHRIGTPEGATDHYLQAWFLVHLLGEKGRLKKEHLRSFVQALADGRPPLEALPVLSGMPNDRLMAEWDAKLESSIKSDESRVESTGPVFGR